MTRRRDVLRTGALALGSVGGLAGCTTTLSPTPGPGTTGPTTPTHNAPAWFTDRGDAANTASANGRISVPLTERWQASLGGAAGTPVGGHGAVLVGADDGTLYALDPGDGSTAWSFDVGTAVTAAPTAVSLTLSGTPPTTTATRLQKGGQDHVFVTGRDGALYSIDPTGPSQRWATAAASGRFVSAPAYATERVFYAAMDTGASSRLRAVAARSGTVEWTSDTHNVTTATPTHGLGNVHLGVPNQTGTILYSYEANSGDGEWEYRDTRNGSGSRTSDVVDTDVAVGEPARIYLGPKETEVAAIRASGGTGIWSTTLPNFGKIFGLALTQDRSPNTLVVAQRRHLHGLDPASGSIRWSYSHGTVARNGGTGRYPQPAIYGDHVFHVVDDDKLVAVSLSGGSEEWRTTLDATTYASPCVGGGTVYVATSNGTVYAFSP